MKFSIIVPAHNAEDYIERCIQSVLIQDFQDYEIVIVDDGSQDRTLELCQLLQSKHERIQVIRKENAGASSARNTGIKAAHGEYLLFLDSDDYWIHENALSALSQNIAKQGAELILFGVRTVNAISGKSKIRVQFLSEEIQYLNLNSLDEQVDFLVRTSKFPSSAWSVAVKASVVRDNNIYFVEGIVAEDLDWIVALFFQDIRVSAVEGIFYQYHKFRPGSVTSESGNLAVESLVYIVDKWVPRLDARSLKDQAIRSFLTFHYSTIFLSYYKISGENKREITARVQRYFWLLEQSKDRRFVLIKRILNWFGFRLGSFLLSWIYRVSLRHKA